MGNYLRKHGELYQTLNDDVLEHCRRVTGFNDNQIRAHHSKFFAVTEDGRLKQSHMDKLLGDYLPAAKKKRSKYLTKCVFSAVDTNNDGYIDFLEYLMSIKFFETDSPVEKADFIFRIIDKNGDNLVTQKELERILKCLEEYHATSSIASVTETMSDGPKPAASAVIKKLDEDRSGSIGVSEFVDGWLKNETIRALFTF